MIVRFGRSPIIKLNANEFGFLQMHRPGTSVSLSVQQWVLEGYHFMRFPGQSYCSVNAQSGRRPNCAVLAQSLHTQALAQLVFLYHLEVFAVGLLARPDRFERPTPWFEAKCSIQMSYGRVS